MYYFAFPKEVNSKSVHSIWTKPRFVKNKSLLAVDFSNVCFIDQEGSNFAVLLTLLLKSNFLHTKVILPSRDDTYTFFKDSGINKIFRESNCELIRQFSLFDPDLHQQSFSYNKLVSRNETSYIPFFKTFYLSNNNIRAFYTSLADGYSTFERNALLFSRATSCFSELVNNFFQHSGVPSGCITIHFKNEGKNKIPYLFISITDFGIGIKKSLLKSPIFQTRKIMSQDDEFFINAALQPGVSSTNRYGRGAGLPIVLKKSDKIIISSGKSRVSITKKDGDYMSVKSYKMTNIPNFGGTSIVCIVKNNNE